MDKRMISIGEHEGLAFAQYFSDESRKKGFAESISFPENESEVRCILEQLHADGTPFTIQGARTGLSGAAVPGGGHILSCIRMKAIGPLNRIENGFAHLHAAAGVTMAEIEEYLAAENSFWPPAPTESGATVGGVLAGKARGIYAVFYGEASDWADQIHKADGVILSARLRLAPLPKSMWAIAFFFPGFEEAAAFIEEANRAAGSFLAALESFNEVSLDCISELKKNAVRLSALPETAGNGAMVYVEIHAQEEALAEDTAAALMDIAERFGSDSDTSWALSGATEVHRIRMICHAAQEAALAVHDANLGGEAPGLDLALKGAEDLEILKNALTRLESLGIETAVFGSLIGGRLRLCPLPKSEEARTAAVRLLADLKGRLSL